MHESDQDMQAVYLSCDQCFRLWASHAIAARNLRDLKTRAAQEHLEAANTAILEHQDSHIYRRRSSAASA